ncbi:adenylate/guanylate cyclase domain-containing protein [Parvularcula marina]|uniref:adenylate/guanylate cyclase domain-containing protein n=1 Tax=Parvularcula marina TaxID=2292771 RepID=UPI003516A018
MSDARFTRKLAAIMAVDVVRYSALVEKDEESALAAVDRARTLISDIITSHGGRIFNHAGDGVMVEMPSVIEGVKAAFEIHKALEADDSDLPRLKVRIGVNLGDVMSREGGDLVGHGVNIASRLESIAKPGETVISQAVYEQLRGTMEALFEAAGYERLKNISSPVAVYRATQEGAPRRIWRLGRTRSSLQKRWVVALGALAIVSVGLIAGLLWPRGSEPVIDGRAIAVLPFTNAGDADSEFFSDGVTEEILALLVRLDDVKVIARASSFQYREEAPDLKAIRRTLGVSHVLEGSVRRSDDRVRVTVSLVDTAANQRLWADSYERQLTDIFAIQRDIAENVADAMKVQLLGVEELPQDRPIDPETYELYLRGRSLLAQRGAAIPQAIAAFEQVTARSPDFADGWAALAMALHVYPGHSTTPYAQIEDQARAAASRALALTPAHPEALAVRGVQARRDHQWQQAEQSFLAALDSDPSNVTAWFWYGEFLLSVGRAQDGVEALSEAAKLDPLSPIMLAGTGWGQFFLGNTEAADKAFTSAWNDYGLRARNVWEGLYSVALQEKDYDRARALVAEMPGRADLRALHEPFIAALENPGPATQSMMKGAFDLLGPERLPYYYPLEGYSRMGLDDEAVTVTLAAAKAGRVDETQILFAPGKAGVRAHPGFAEIAEALGLIAYWREAGAPDFCEDTPKSATCQALTASGS